MAIDPKQILKILGDLLSPSGGIKSPDEVSQVINLMTKFSRKMVSKCVYIHILKSTSDHVVPVFLIKSGWELLTFWLSDAMTVKNWSFIRQLLLLFLKLPSPVFMNVENVNTTKNLLGNLCGLQVPEEITTLVFQLLNKWESDHIAECGRIKKMKTVPGEVERKMGIKINDQKQKGRLENDNDNDVKEVVKNFTDDEIINYESVPLKEINMNNEVERKVVRKPETKSKIKPNRAIIKTKKMNIGQNDNGVNEVVDNVTNDEMINYDSVPLVEINMNNELERKVMRKPVIKSKSQPNQGIIKTKKMNICEKQAQSKDAFSKHINVMEEPDGTKVFRCTNVECDFPPTIHSVKALKHAILHSKGIKTKPRKKKANIRCTKCDFTCSRKVELNKHWKANHGQNEKVLCSQCLKSFSTNQSLKRHISSVHVKFTNDEAVSCTICNKVLRDQTAMKRHVQRVHTEKKFQCHNCPETFSRQCALNNHIKKSHDGNAVKHQCEECWKVFEDRSKLLRHSKVHGKNIQSIFKCDKCPQQFSCVGNLKRHIKVVHDKIKTLTCRWCDKSFRDNYHKVRHEVTNHIVGQETKEIDGNVTYNDLNDKNNIFQFSLPCAMDTGSGVDSDDEVTEELKFNFCGPSMVENSFKQSCINEIDDKQEKFEFSLPILKGSKHSSSGNRVKKQCPAFIFSKPSNAKVPLLKSTREETVLKCKECNSIFSKAFYLEEHLKSIHGLKFIHCEKCEKDFPSKYSFFQHRPCVTKCILCDQMFSRVFHLKRHVKLVHKI